MTDRTRPNALRATAFAACAALLTFAACQVDRPSIVAPERAEAIEEVATESPFAVELRVEGSVVTGSVTDAETGQPVEAAQVSIPALAMGALTNARGRFLLLNLPHGEHEILIEHGSIDPLYLPAIHVENGQPGPQPRSTPPETPPTLTVRPETVDEATRDEIRQIRELPAPPAAAPNSGTFTGTVVALDGTPVQAAQISIPALNIGALSNIEGRFLLRVPEGTHEVEIGHFNPETRESRTLSTIRIEVTAGETTRRDRIEIERR